MADLKISQLTNATTPLAGTETVPLVQSGVTKKVTVASLTAGRSVSVSELISDDGTFGRWSIGQDAGGNKLFSTTPGFGGWRTASIQANGTGANMTWASDGNTTFGVGNLVQGTAARGINFTANTPAAGMTSQLLNWYEEGTWTPVVSGTGTAGTYELAAGTVATYTRIGRQVTINASIVLAAAITGGGTGSLKITGLPFAKASGQQAPGVFGGYSVDFDASVLYTSTFFSTTASSSTLLVTQYKDNTAYALLPITAIAANSEMYISVTYFA